MTRYHILKFLVALIAIVALTSCYEEKKREVISDRYSSGRKRIVNVYKGSGSDESLFEKRFYSHNGFLLRKERPSEPWDEWPRHERTFGDIYLRDGEVDLNKYIEGTWVSRHTVEVSEDIVAMEKHTMSIDNSYVLRNIEVKGCADDEYKLAYWSRFKIKNLGKAEKSYFVNVEEVEKEKKGGMDLKNWLGFIESYKRAHGDDFETTLYLRKLEMDAEVPATKVDAIVPKYIPGEYEEHIEDPGSGILWTSRIKKGCGGSKYLTSEKGCLNPFENEFGDVHHSYFVPKEAYKESKCEV